MKRGGNGSCFVCCARERAAGVAASDLRRGRAALAGPEFEAKVAAGEQRPRTLDH
jgi:hypothetical protein